MVSNFTSSPHSLVITCCTNRKRRIKNHKIIVFPQPFSCDDLESFVGRWIKSFECSENSCLQASERYVGKTISDAKTISDFLDAKLFIISAGMGLIEGSAEIPNYNLTFSDNGGVLNSALKKTKTLVFLFCELKCNDKIITSASGVWKILKRS